MTYRKNLGGSGSVVQSLCYGPRKKLPWQHSLDVITRTSRACFAVQRGVHEFYEVENFFTCQYVLLRDVSSMTSLK